MKVQFEKEVRRHLPQGTLRLNCRELLLGEVGLAHASMNDRILSVSRVTFLMCGDRQEPQRRA